jgi:signal transduction histidine kinase
METVLFRVVQEALTNVVRHAVASHVQVMIIKHEDDLDLVIKDNGIGFNVHAVRERASGDLTLGLLGMQERVQLIGGKIQIASHPDHGTEIRAIFNLSSTQNSAQTNR